MAELGRAVFGEDRERSFKSVVDCFDKIGQERFEKFYTKTMRLLAFNFYHPIDSR